MPNKITVGYKLDEHISSPEVVSSFEAAYKLIAQREAWSNENSIEDRFYNIAVTPVASVTQSFEVKDSADVSYDPAQGHGEEIVYAAAAQEADAVAPAQVVQPTDTQPIQPDDTKRPIDSTTGTPCGPNGAPGEPVQDSFEPDQTDQADAVAPAKKAK